MSKCAAFRQTEWMPQQSLTSSKKMYVRQPFTSFAWFLSPFIVVSVIKTAKSL